MKKINVIAMAGSGQRFIDKNYNIPKPLIIIKKKPMFYYATKSLPIAKKNIFICNKKITSTKEFKFFKKKFFLKSQIIKLKSITNGQATTCRLASKYLTDNDIVTYGSCDFFFNFDQKNFNKLIKLNDLIIFVHKPNKINITNFRDYGWVKKGKLNSVVKINCKKKASNNPKEDFVITGTFTFKNKNIFHHCYNKMVSEKDKVKNEFYMDTVAKYALGLKYKVKYILVKNFKSYGTPRELIKNG
tara:strand:- start:12 stop:743 length:732 start_codon:yes stop_codon:yes gene_type:complete